MSVLDEIREAFSKVVELEGPERAALLATLPEGIRAEVDSLLAAHESAGSFLADTEDEASRDGESIGPYVLGEKIGQGGMGVVYRARRDDGEFQREVAIKLVGGRLFAPEAERRFIEERRILALLDHPNIIRMIDGGISKGQRYLVMELVSGRPVTEYVRKHGLSIRERLRLFQSICSAVQYAHQHLILHRDLKPQNILVTSNGQVKVLDFGIARLVDDTATDAATTALHPMTLACASPEQVRGDRLTLASDIYSMGLLLYELLTGTNTQSEGTQAEIIERIANADPPAPSKLDAGVSADLDAVVSKALSKEASRRYASAEEMSADLGRILENRPVLARSPSWTYYAGRFFARNKALTSVSAGLAFAVMAGLIAFLWQAHRAEQQRSIAERRFDEARRMIYTVIHEIQPKLASINGTVLLRQTLIERTLVYLEVLGKDAGDNPALLRELIEAYLQLATVSGDMNNPSTGDYQRARQAFDKAGALAKTLLRADPDNPASLRTLTHYFRQAAMDAMDYATRDKAQAWARQGLAAAERLAVAAPADASVQNDLASAVATLAATSYDGDLKISQYERAVMIWERLLNARPSDSIRTNVALMYKSLSGCWSNKNDQRRALDYARKARAVDEELLSENPSSPAARMALAFDIGSIGWAYFLLSDYSHALVSMRENVALRESVVLSNPADRRAEDRLAYALGDLAKTENKLGDHAAERRSLHRVMEIYARHTRSGPLGPQSLRRFAMSHYRLGQIDLDAGRKGPACAWFRKATDLFDQYEHKAGRLPEDAAESEQVRTAVRGCRSQAAVTVLSY